MYVFLPSLMPIFAKTLAKVADAQVLWLKKSLP